jgi:predicted FMN-binding regulatory protein PaiB
MWRATTLQGFEPAIGEALVIIQGSDAYISPSWYASKAEHGRVVPTWNYSTAHVYGRLMVHDDPAWISPARCGASRTPTRLSFNHPWSVDDAPERYVSGQLRAIVGLELVITRIEAKAKLSQNRPDGRHRRRGGRACRAGSDGDGGRRRAVQAGPECVTFGRSTEMGARIGAGQAMKED